MENVKCEVCDRTERLFQWWAAGEFEKTRRKVHSRCIFVQEINGYMRFGSGRIAMERYPAEERGGEKPLFRAVPCEEWNIVEACYPAADLCFYIIWDAKSIKVVAIVQTHNRKRLESWILVRDVYGADQRICEAGIYCLEACGNHTRIYFGDGETEARERFDSICGRLSVPSFLKVHRSYMVNLCYLKRITRYFIELYNGLLVPVPAKKYKRVLERVHLFTVNSSHNA